MENALLQVLLSAKGRSQVWNALTNLQLPLCAGVEGEIVHLDAASENAPVLVSLNSKGRVQVWNALTKECVANFPARNATSLVSPFLYVVYLPPGAGSCSAWTLA